MMLRRCCCRHFLSATLQILCLVFVATSKGHLFAAAVDENKCTLYIAESSIEGVNGIGIYTAKSFEKGSIITPPDSPSIPVCGPLPGIVKSYWWAERSGTTDALSFECHAFTFDYFVMFGALPNYHTYLDNIRIRPNEETYDDSFVQTTTNPGAGAFSYHGGRTILAAKDIEEGEELFLNYGLDDSNDYGGHWFEHVPRFTDFVVGGNIMEKIWSHLKAIQVDVADPVLAEKVLHHALATVRETAAESGNDRIAFILPKTIEQLDRVLGRSDGEMPALAEALAKEVSVRRRSAHWLTEHGRCVDNIVPGRSTLPFAGRGAFAQRRIARGEVVVPVPLIHFMNADALTIWEWAQDEFGDWIEVPSGKELLMNYCFGHEESSLLLCPITNAILINHCSNRTKECGRSGPNAEYNWDTEWDRDTARWLNMTLDEIAEEGGRGLSFEIVATRTIEPGEEVFIDYGVAWENAWLDHVEQWVAEKAEPLNSVKQWNDEINVPIKILSDNLRVIAHHDKITTGCVYWDEFAEDVLGYDEYWENDEWDVEKLADIAETDVLWRYDENGQRYYRPFLFEEAAEQLEISPSNDLWHEFSDEEILWYFSEDGSQFTLENSHRASSNYWPCSVVREEGDGSYIVQVFEQPYSVDSRPFWVEQELPRFLTNYPRESILYFPMPDRSDMHLATAFRHHIDIRDEIFPNHWRDRGEQYNNDSDESDGRNDGEL